MALQTKKILKCEITCDMCGKKKSYDVSKDFIDIDFSAIAIKNSIHIKMCEGDKLNDDRVLRYMRGEPDKYILCNDCVKRIEKFIENKGEVKSNE